MKRPHRLTRERHEFFADGVRDGLALLSEIWTLGIASYSVRSRQARHAERAVRALESINLMLMDKCAAEWPDLCGRYQRESEHRLIERLPTRKEPLTWEEHLVLGQALADFRNEVLIKVAVELPNAYGLNGIEYKRSNRAMKALDYLRSVMDGVAGVGTIRWTRNGSTSSYFPYYPQKKKRGALIEGPKAIPVGSTDRQ